MQLTLLGTATALLAEAEAATAHRAHTPGAVSTPLPVALSVMDDALAAWDRPGLPTVLDPACGTGPFLVAAALRLWERGGATTQDERRAIVQRHIHGWELDHETAAVARRLFLRWLDVDPIETRDALEPPSPRFDLVVGNPPWVDSTAMAPARRAELHARYALARGNWDLWCPFVERALQLTADDGVHAFIVPDKLASAAFAAPVRARLASHGVHTLRSVGRVFEDHSVVGTAYVAGRPGVDLPADGSPWVMPGASRALLAALEGMPTLDTVAKVHGAATVAEAYLWGDALTDGGEGHRLVNSGLIDPWKSHWGQRDMRYLKRRWTEPRVPHDTLSARRQDFATRPKLIVAGMTRDLEVLPDIDGTWLAAKSTTIVLPEVPLLGLAAWMNSRAASCWYRAVYGSLSFRGGYLRVGPPQLRTLPVPPLPEEALRLGEAALADPEGPAPSRIDALFDELLGVPTDAL